MVFSTETFILCLLFFVHKYYLCTRLAGNKRQAKHIGNIAEWSSW